VPADAQQAKAKVKLKIWNVKAWKLEIWSKLLSWTSPALLYGKKSACTGLMCATLWQDLSE
jgi:hypothetical protein